MTIISACFRKLGRLPALLFLELIACESATRFTDRAFEIKAARPEIRFGQREKRVKRLHSMML